MIRNLAKGTMYESHFTKAFAGNSRRAAITAKCLECTGLDRVAIRDCMAKPTSAAPCPLWLYRPYQAEEEDDERNE